MAFMFYSFKLPLFSQGDYNSFGALQMKLLYVTWHMPLCHSSQKVNCAGWKPGVVKRRGGVRERVLLLFIISRTAAQGGWNLAGLLCTSLRLKSFEARLRAAGGRGVLSRQQASLQNSSRNEQRTLQRESPSRVLGTIS